MFQGEAKPKRPAPSHPKTLDMVVEAITTLNEKNGASVQAIKNWILSNYQTVDPNRIRPLLKQALAKGLETGILVRPMRSMAAVGATGRFKIGKLPKPEKKKKPVKEKAKKKPAKKAAKKDADTSMGGSTPTKKVKTKKTKSPAAKKERSGSKERKGKSPAKKAKTTKAVAEKKKKAKSPSKKKEKSKVKDTKPKSKPKPKPKAATAKKTPTKKSKK